MKDYAQRQADVGKIGDRAHTRYQSITNTAFAKSHPEYVNSYVCGYVFYAILLESMNRINLCT